jgi:hypothetical protein
MINQHQRVKTAMEPLNTTAEQSLLVKLATVLVLASLLGACQMPSPMSSSGQSVPSGSSGSSGGGMPAPPTGGAPSSPGAPSDPAGGASSSSDSNGDQQQSGGGDSGGEGQQGESVEGLDAELDASLEGFDDSMSSGSSSGSDEIDILSPRGSTRVTDNSDEPLFEEADSGTPEQGNEVIEQAAQNGPEGQDGSEGAANASASETTGSRGGAQQQADAAVIPVPDDIGDGQGDDIVLRQIRDAAMKETDPVLRERLWDEYRRIKDQ